MALNGMEIGLLIGVLAFAALLAVGTWLLGDVNSGAGIALTIIGALGVVAFALALIFAGDNDRVVIDAVAA
jgi:hypothetical protein